MILNCRCESDHTCLRCQGQRVRCGTKSWLRMGIQCRPLGMLEALRANAMDSPTQNARTQGSTSTLTRDAKCSFIPWPCQTGWGMSSALVCPMTFKNEVVSDEDIDRYNLPFPKGGGRWWTRDVDRDYYLWGGLVGNLAYETKQEGVFYLYVNNILYDIRIEPADFLNEDRTLETVIQWQEILSINPEPSASVKTQVVEILKEALVSFGFDGRKNIYFSRLRVEFKF